MWYDANVKMALSAALPAAACKNQPIGTPMNQKKGSGTHMYCVRNVTSDLYWVGANDRRLALFEGVYKIPKGVSYNSYVLLDDKTVVFDTVDASASRQYLENVAHVLGGRKLDYVIVQHMEPDHAATLAELVLR